MVLVAISAITVSVTTRYCSPLDPSSHTITVAKIQVPADAKRQHLNKTAFGWIPPAFSITNLDLPRFCPRFAPANPLSPDLLLAESLYNRPPPSI